MAEASNVISGGGAKAAAASKAVVAPDPAKTLNDARFADIGKRNAPAPEGRVPFILTCLSWMTQGRYMIFWVNPSDVTWNLKLRGTTTQVKGGTLSYIWRDSTRPVGAPKGSSFFDEPRINITFKTGNCMPVRETGSGVVRIPPGLVDLYEFIELMNEPMVLDDGTNNYRVIFYNSILFPQIILYGWFTPEQGFSFTESAEDPAQTSWSHEFIVRKTNPPFMNAAALVRSYEMYAASGSISAQTSASGISATDMQAMLNDNTQAPITSDKKENPSINNIGANQSKTLNPVVTKGSTTLSPVVINLPSNMPNYTPVSQNQSTLPLTYTPYTPAVTPLPSNLTTVVKK